MSINLKCPICDESITLKDLSFGSSQKPKEIIARGFF